LPETENHPHAHGDERLIAILRREIVDAGVATSAAVGFAHRGVIATAELLSHDVEADALFDLASLTKPLTALSLLSAVADGRLTLATRISEVLSEARDSAVANRTIGELLAHRGGLPAWGALYRRDPWAVKVPSSLAPDEEPSIERMLLRAAHSATASTAEVYSDIGYVLLGAIAERIATPIIPDRRVIERMPPTEIVAWRGVVRGEVHDENAAMIARTGHRPGHAGAFATIGEVMQLALRVLDTLHDRDAILPPPLARTMIEPIAGGTHVLGWDLRSGAAPSSGTYFGPRTFGHLGFTGTSVWIDPDEEMIVALLTNRTYPSRDNLRIRAARPRVHDAVVTELRRSSS
jgi:serine-type D-Ala-D-Ala carboxypeptidase